MLTTIALTEQNRICDRIMHHGYRPSQARIAARIVRRLVNTQGVTDPVLATSFAANELGDHRLTSIAIDSITPPPPLRR